MSWLWLGANPDSVRPDCVESSRPPPADGAATLFISGYQLFLYNGDGQSHQQFTVDVDIKQQDNLKYFNNANGKLDPSLKTKGWLLSPGERTISFNDFPFFACPADEGGYRLDLARSQDESHAGCIPFEVRTNEQDRPVRCMYTE
ncbi:uncharacterized protein C8A04DRAFT_29891 [Dichotomopilus funicola]|uniref:Uncharacterized protein n=1 Tax=Dichotomopilus funicola TaxID=1934379 RepID=A0AAN6V053_9PEZI|nr:hypothetical protein C8A04DRAFT_29891 [Dichotomopilus funicola]